MKSIQRHTAELRKERLSHKRANILSRESMKYKAGIGKEATSLSSVFGGMNSFVDAARMSGAGYDPGVARGSWRVTARAPQRPYQPILRDVYPRNEYTMMPTYNAPKYYTGNFLKYDYKDVPQQPSDHDEGRPVVFKKQDIEAVQTKKKYGGNLKGQSTVALHLSNDTQSLLYQRSLHPETRDRSHLTQNSSKSMDDVFSFHKKEKNEVSALHPLKYSDPVQTWIDTKYPTDRRTRTVPSTAGSSTIFGPTNRLVGLESPGLRSGRIKSSKTAPEWYSEFFPREKVANALKFMGEAKESVPKHKQSYDVNFNGKQ